MITFFIGLGIGIVIGAAAVCLLGWWLSNNWWSGFGN